MAGPVNASTTPQFWFAVLPLLPPTEGRFVPTQPELAPNCCPPTAPPASGRPASGKAVGRAVGKAGRPGVVRALAPATGPARAATTLTAITAERSRAKRALLGFLRWGFMARMIPRRAPCAICPRERFDRDRSARRRRPRPAPGLGDIRHRPSGQPHASRPPRTTSGPTTSVRRAGPLDMSVDAQRLREQAGRRGGRSHRRGLNPRQVGQLHDRVDDRGELERLAGLEVLQRRRRVLAYLVAALE